MIKAVENAGFEQKGGRGRTGTHRTWAKPGLPGELHRTVTIPLAKKRIPHGTMSSMLRQLGIDEATLREWLTRKSTAAKPPATSESKASKLPPPAGPHEQRRRKAGAQ